MKVLIALDDSIYSQIVLDAVEKREWKADTEFVVLSVVALPSLGYWQDYGLDVDAQLQKALTEKCQSLVANGIAQLRTALGKDRNIDGRVLTGHAADQIVQLAVDLQVDLIMLGTRGHRGLKKLFLGSVAQEVLREAPCSVEILKAPQTVKEKAAEKVAVAQKA